MPWPATVRSACSRRRPNQAITTELEAIGFSAFRTTTALRAPSTERRPIPHILGIEDPPSLLLYRFYRPGPAHGPPLFGRASPHGIVFPVPFLLDGQPMDSSLGE